jgi:tetratricopeptide (TPR) repeat protein
LHFNLPVIWIPLQMHGQNSYFCVSNQILMKQLFNLLFLPLLFLFSCNKLLADGKPEEAQKLFKELTVSHPRDPRSWLGLGISKAKLVDHDGAIVEYNKAAALLSEAPDSIKGKTYYNRGMSYFAIANFAECMADMNEAIKLKYNLADCYAFLGVSQGSSGDEVAALTTLGLALKADPKHLWALSNRGYYASKLGDNQTAVRDLTLLTQLTPTDVGAWLNLGYTYLQSEDVVNAE